MRPTQEERSFAERFVTTARALRCSDPARRFLERTLAAVIQRRGNGCSEPGF